MVAHGATAGLSGVAKSLSGRYTSVIHIGTALWATGAGMKSTYDRDMPVRIILVVPVLRGISVRCSLQPGAFRSRSFPEFSGEQFLY